MEIRFPCLASTTKQSKLTWILPLLLVLATIIRVHGQSGNTSHSLLVDAPISSLLQLAHHSDSSCRTGIPLSSDLHTLEVVLCFQVKHNFLTLQGSQETMKIMLCVKRKLRGKW